MFGWLFGRKKSEAPPIASADVVWLTARARESALVADARSLAEEGDAVIVVVPTRAVLERLTDAITTARDGREPVRCTSALDANALRAALATAGTVSLAMGTALPPLTAPLANPGPALEVLVGGRDARRAVDDAIVAWAATARPDAAHVTFHLSLEDPLLAQHAQNLRPLLEKIGMKEDEPIESPLVTRAIANAQQ